VMMFFSVRLNLYHFWWSALMPGHVFLLSNKILGSVS
jgi:hypothetical protein